MNITYMIVIALGIGSVIISLSMVMITAVERPSKEQTRFLLMMCFVLVTCLGGLLEYVSTTDDAALIAVKVGYIGRIFSIILLPRFILEYTHKQQDERIQAIIRNVNGFMLLLVLTTEYHNFFYKSWRIDRSGPFPVFRAEHNFLYYVLTFEMYFIFIVIIFYILKLIQKAETKQDQVKYRGILAGIMIPIISIVLGQLRLTWDYDPLPLSLMVTCIIFLFVVKKYHLFDIEHHAKEFVLDNSHEAVLILDRNLDILYANQVFVEEELKDIVLEEILKNDHNWFEGNKHQFQTKNKHFEIYKKNLFHEDGVLEGYLLEIRDITFQRNTYIEIERLKKEAENANIAKSAFLANMSHEIRTPINAVIGMNEIILRESDEKNIIDYAENIRDSGKELLALINDILDFSKLESGKLTILPTEYEVNDLLLNVIQNAREQQQTLTTEHGRMAFYVSKDVPRVLYGDQNRMEQLYAGLIKLSIIAEHYRNCRYEICVERVHSPSIGWGNTKYPCIYLQFVLTHYERTKDEAMRQQLFREFDPDANNHKDIEGGNLTIALVDKLIGEMKGTMESKLLQDGSEQFVCSIPQGVVNDETIPNLEEMVNSQQFRARRKEGELFAPSAKILVVDDNSVNLKVIQGLLKRTQIQVEVAMSGKECLSRILEKEYDLIFMDHMMPEMDGIDTLHAMQNEEGNLCKEKPVIILTANVVPGAREMYMKKGFSDYLMKPVNSEELENMLWNYLPKEKTNDQKEAAM